MYESVVTRRAWWLTAACWLAFAMRPAAAQSDPAPTPGARPTATAALDPTAPTSDVAQAVRAAIAGERTDEARTAWLALARVQPDHPQLSRWCEAVVHQLCARQEFDQVSVVLGEYACLAELTPRLRYYQALSALAADDCQTALEILVQLSPQDCAELGPVVHAALSRTYFATGDFLAARHAAMSYLAAGEVGPEADTCQARAILAALELTHVDRAMTELNGWRASVQDMAAWQRCAVALADALNRSERHHDAAHWYQQALSVGEEGEPSEIQRAQYGLGWAKYKLGEYAQAAASFAQVDEHDGRGAHAAWLRAICTAQTEPPPSAIAAYEQVVARHPESEYAPRAMLQAARLLEREHQHDRALAWLNRYVEEHPQAAELDAARYLQSGLLTALGRHTDARQSLETLHKLHPDSRYWLDATYRLAAAAARSGDAERAETYLQAVLNREDNSAVAAHALYLRGQLAAAKGAWPQVAAANQEVLQRADDQSLQMLAEYWLAEAHYQQANYAAAGAGFARVAGTTSQVHGRWVADAQLRQAQSLAHVGEWSEAREVAAAIEGRFPFFERRHEVDYLLGRCAMSLAHYDEAREAFRRVARQPVARRTELCVMSEWMIGETYLHQHRFEEARQAYEVAARHRNRPHWRAASLLQIGKCQEAQQRWEEAAAAYYAVTARHDDSPFVGEAAERLRQLAPHLTSPSAARPIREGQPAAAPTSDWR